MTTVITHAKRIRRRQPPARICQCGAVAIWNIKVRWVCDDCFGPIFRNGVEIMQAEEELAEHLCEGLRLS